MLVGHSGGVEGHSDLRTVGGNFKFNKFQITWSGFVVLCGPVACDLLVSGQFFYQYAQVCLRFLNWPSFYEKMLITLWKLSQRIELIAPWQGIGYFSLSVDFLNKTYQI